MNPVIEQLLRSQLDSVEYRIGLHDTNISAIEAQLSTAEAERAELVTEADALRAALPAEPEAEEAEA